MARETTNSIAATPRHIHPAAWIAWILAAIFLAAALWLAHHIAWMRAQLNLAQGAASQTRVQLEHADQILDVLTSPQTRHIVLSETRQAVHPVGQVSWLAEKGSLIFVAGGLRPISANKTYELWLVPSSGKAPIPAGLFRPDADGGATVVMAPVPAQTPAKSFMVTVEPLHGSETPSLPIIMQGQ
jgi:anti-sigma-K factor RskA